MLKVGTILHGTYRIDGYLSSGGFGNTYVATKVEFGEKYAIKEFFMRGVSQRDSNNTTVSVSNVENETAFASQLEKFKKEARRLRTLNSEHIVKVYDLFDENGTSYYVMDYIEGESLSQWLKRTGKHMSEKRVLQILPQILDALEVAHNEGILHLDLKPANIMMDKLGNVKLIDFGASKQQSMSGGATSTSAIAYSKGYAPREQMEQNPKKFGPWTDFYALGATLYNLLTNKKPPLSSDIDDDTSIDKHEALPMPSTISDKTKQLVIWLMATNRFKRPKNVEQIKNYLNDKRTTGKPLKSNNTSTKRVDIEENTKLALNAHETHVENLDNKNRETNKEDLNEGRPLFTNVFSFDGRIRKTEYWLSWWLFLILPLVDSGVSYFFAPHKKLFEVGIGRIIALITFIWWVIFMAFQNTKRLHDIGKSGWKQLLFPSFIYDAEYKEGDKGDNKYGPDPRGNVGSIKSIVLLFKREKIIISIILSCL